MISQLIFWSIVGWCGTPFPRPPRFPGFPIPPDPPPAPLPWWKNALIGIVGGIAGGFLVNTGLGFDELVASSFGALAGGRILSDIAGPMLNTTKKNT